MSDVERTVSVGSVVDLPADTVLGLLHRADTLRYICRPWVRGGPLRRRRWAAPA